MDFPTFTKNATVETQPLTVNPPAFDANAGNAKTVEQVRVEQQWRDVVRDGVHQRHPLSLNRDAAEVTADPYTS